MSSHGNHKSEILTVSTSRAKFRFHDELNDFLPGGQKNRTIDYEFDDNPSIKDSIEATGVPHTEVDLIVVNGISVDFDYHTQDGDEVSVYPVFSDVDVSAKLPLRDKPEPEFVVDVNLGKLTKLLRMCGFDAIYQNNYTDHDVAQIAASENRIVLTRDRRLLKHKIITHGYWLRSDNPDRQICEVLWRFDLFEIIEPFNICLECNGIIKPVEKDKVLDNLEPKTIRYFDEFYQCCDCRRIYWKGSHYEHMDKFLAKIKRRNHSRVNSASTLK